MVNNNQVYILNYWWAANYGALLTAYAINKLIKNSVLIDNSDKIQLKVQEHYTFHKIFAQKYLKIVSNSDVNSGGNKSVYIVGSDQVFNPNINSRIFESFLLKNVPSNAKKIAISASFGVDKELFKKENSNATIENIKKSLQTFDFISVREDSGLDICKDLLNVDADLIIDPVFILEKNEYEELIKKATLNYENSVINFIIHDFEDSRGVLKKSKSIMNLSVENWLSAIKSCKYLITDSYHAMCFAIIFNKPFIVLTNSEKAGARFDSLFRMLGIQNQSIGTISEIQQRDCVFKIDYEGVNRRLEEERQKGLNFLQKVLEAPVTKQKEKENVRVEYLERKVCELEIQATLKYQIKKGLWNLWLIIWHRYLPKFIKRVLNLFRKGKQNA